MTIQSATPESGSIVQRGEIITVVWDQTVSGGPPTVIYEPGGGNPNEEVYVGGFPAFQPGYTGSRVFDPLNNTWILSFKRNAGWGGSSFGVSVYYQLVRNDLTYTILAEGQYPPDMQPFNDPAAQVGTGEVLIQDSGVTQGSATTLNLADNLTVAVSGGVATIDADDTGTDITVIDESQTIAPALTKMTFTGGGVKATAPGAANEIIVTIPGGDGTADGLGVIGTVQVISGVTNVSANSVGINSSLTSVDVQDQTVHVYFESAFPNEDYFVQVTSVTKNAYPWLWGKYPTHIAVRLTDETGSPVNPTVGGLRIDVLAQSDPGGGSSGDVTSSESSGTVQNAELAVFDGTTGKLIKGAGTGTYSANGTVHGNVMHGSSSVSTGGYISVSSPTATVFVAEYNTGAPTGIAGGGQWWVKPDTGDANLPMFTDGDGTEYDLTSGTAGTVDTVVGGTGISVNSADSANPIVSTDDGAIVHDSLSGFVAAEHLDWSSDLGGTQVHANNYTSGSGITSWNTLTGAVTSIYVQAADPDLTITPNPGDIWIEIP